MARSHRIAAVWNWLPAFRVVAEYESIHKAAVVLSVSASALSRTVRLLEDALGEALFVRNSTGLGLTAFGAEVLRGTRDAMRRVDDVLAAPSSHAHESRPLVVGASGAALPFLLAHAVGRAAREPTSPQFRMTLLDEVDTVSELLRGNVDVAFVEEACTLMDICCESLGEIGFALFAPRGAPKAAAVVALEGLAFESARIAAFAPTVDAVVHIAAEGALLALLPDGLAPLTFERLALTDARMTVHAYTRRPLDASCTHDGARALLDAVRALLVPAAPTPYDAGTVDDDGLSRQRVVAATPTA